MNYSIWPFGHQKWPKRGQNVLEAEQFATSKYRKPSQVEPGASHFAIIEAILLVQLKPNSITLSSYSWFASWSATC